MARKNQKMAKASSAKTQAVKQAVITFSTWRDAMLRANRFSSTLWGSSGTNNMLNVPQLKGTFNIAGRDVPGTALKDSRNLEVAFGADPDNTFKVLTRGNDLDKYALSAGGIAVLIAVIASNETGKRRRFAEAVLQAVSEYHGHQNTAAMYAALGEQKRGRKGTDKADKVDLSVLLQTPASR